MRLAIVCSWLNQHGGAERVLEVLHDMYPRAPIYTSVYTPSALPEAYREWDIRPSFLNNLPLAIIRPQMMLPLYPLAFEHFDLRGYDVVLSITSAFAHGILTTPGTAHVCYCLTPARFLWNYHGYIEREGIPRLTRMALCPFLKGLRQWDRAAADRVDTFVAISRTVRERIKKYYRRDAEIIYPPVRTDYFASEAAPEEYFLIVSRLVPYKRIDLAVRAFNQLGLPLRIVGDGRDRRALEALAKPNVQFLGYIPDAQVREQMARCRALIFPGEEDFGITPIEAMAAGRPVVAYAAGGALDTIEHGCTGILFHQPTPAALVEAVRQVDAHDFAPKALRQHARRYDVATFRRRLEQLLSRYAPREPEKRTRATPR